MHIIICTMYPATPGPLRIYLQVFSYDQSRELRRERYHRPSRPVDYSRRDAPPFNILEIIGVNEEKCGVHL